MALQFDTLRYVVKLKSAGVPESQAKARAEALSTALGQYASWESTTKNGFVDINTRLADIRTGLADIRTGLADIRTGLAEIRIGLADIKSDLKLMKWMLVPVAAGVLSLVMKAYT